MNGRILTPWNGLILMNDSNEILIINTTKHTRSICFWTRSKSSQDLRTCSCPYCTIHEVKGLLLTIVLLLPMDKLHLVIRINGGWSKCYRRYSTRKYRYYSTHFFEIWKQRLSQIFILNYVNGILGFSYDNLRKVENIELWN
jgi:hypothetical protein